MSQTTDEISPAVPPGTDAAAPRVVHPDVILGICCMSLLLVGMDVTIVNVALPAIGHDLGAKLAGMQWVVDAYTLVVASFLMASGATADRVGRRRTFQTGMLLFSLGSLLCSVAPNIGTLIGFRALQGLGASMLNPVALSIIANVFTEKRARARAIGIWGTVAGLSLAVGPVVGGVLVQTIGWRSVFWVNLPIGATALILTARFVPESKALKPRAVDPVGQGLVFTALASLTYAVIEGHHRGWHSNVILLLFFLSALAIASLALYEPTRKEPLLDLRFFRSVPFSSATVIAVCSFATFAGFLFVNALYLQQARGFSALRTGLCTLPMAVGMAVGSPFSARLLAARGTLLSLLISGSALTISCLLLTQLSLWTPIWQLLLLYGLFGLGVGFVNPPIAHTAVSGMPPAQAGVAAAVASTSRQIGAALGVAGAGAIVATGRMHDVDLARASHPVWWAMVGCGAMIVLLGIVSNTKLARASAETFSTFAPPRSDNA